MEGISNRSKYIAKVAKHFCNPIRVEILKRLLQKELNVTELQELMGLEQSVLSKHLAVLREGGIISCSVQGRCRLYALQCVESITKTLNELQCLTEMV